MDYLQYGRILNNRRIIANYVLNLVINGLPSILKIKLK